MKKNNVLYGVVAIVFVAIGVFFANHHTSTVPAQGDAVSRLFSYTMNDTAGRPQALAQWKDKLLVVNFWATWCAPCVEEMPELSELQPEIAASKIQIIGIGIDSPANIAEFSRKHNITYPLYVGGMDASELSRQLGNQAGGLPFTVLIGRNGQVKKTYVGRLKMNQLRKDLATLSSA